MYIYLMSTTILVVYDRCRDYPYHKRVTMHTINYIKCPRAIASVRDGLLVTRDMNSHKLTTSFDASDTRKTREKSVYFYFIIAINNVWIISVRDLDFRSFVLCNVKIVSPSLLPFPPTRAATLTMALNTLSLHLGECYSITKVINVLSRRSFAPRASLS